MIPGKAGEIGFIYYQHRAKIACTSGDDSPVDKSRRWQRLTGNDYTQNVQVGSDDMNPPPGIHSGEFGSPVESGQHIIFDNDLVADDMARTSFYPNHAACPVVRKVNVHGNAVMGHDYPFFVLYCCTLFFQDSPLWMIIQEFLSWTIS
jgi:hypothetical protein